MDILSFGSLCSSLLIKLSIESDDPSVDAADELEGVNDDIVDVPDDIEDDDDVLKSRDRNAKLFLDISNVCSSSMAEGSKPGIGTVFVGVASVSLTHSSGIL